MGTKSFSRLEGEYTIGTKSFPRLQMVNIYGTVVTMSYASGILNFFLRDVPTVGLLQLAVR